MSQSSNVETVVECTASKSEELDEQETAVNKHATNDKTAEPNEKEQKTNVDESQSSYHKLIIGELLGRIRSD
eukprot:6417054-Prymnesium_polylepis.2